MSDREATQVFAIRSVITSHCGETLTPDKVESICQEIENEIRFGPCAWSFSAPKQQTEQNEKRSKQNDQL